MAWLLINERWYGIFFAVGLHTKYSTRRKTDKTQTKPIRANAYCIYCMFEKLIWKLDILLVQTSVEAGFHFGEFGRATKRCAIRECAARNPRWKRAFTGERAVSSGSWIKFNFFRGQNERKPISLLLFNDRACDCTGSRDQVHWSGKPALGKHPRLA